MEIDNAIFRESYGKEKFFKTAMENFWICVLEYSEIS